MKTESYLYMTKERILFFQEVADRFVACGNEYILQQTVDLFRKSKRERINVTENLFQ